ncbi:MAG: DUF177 domain-containing protein [Acidobacteria bacterium]|nr:DUF177 domain-containing protein [Acidobacteriota bacterium]MBI3473152.1 DUF177 domain-containing protein [Candidatus Solibacter usitatus]
MFLNIKDMEVRKIHFAESFEPGELDLAERGLRQITALDAEGTAELLENTGNQVRIQGQFRGEVEADCDRCLQPARFWLEERFDLFYRPQADAASGEEIEIDEGEAEIAFYQGLGLELKDVVLEQLMLALPMQTLCRPDCRGTCPVCGGNRNETPCECQARPGDDRWSALKNLAIRNQ